MEINYKSKDRLGLLKHPLMGIAFHNWLKLIISQRGGISLSYWPKAFVITMISILNSPLQLLEYLLFSRKIKSQVVKSPTFILGHPRSGTTFLYYLMSRDEHFGYCTIHESLLPHTFIVGGKLFKSIISKSLPPTRPQDKIIVNADSPQEEELAIACLSGISYMNSFFFPKNALSNYNESVLFKNEKAKRRWKKAFKFYIQKLTYVKKGKPLLLKSPANTGRIKEILEVFPDAKFVHIHRDPIEVYQSTIKLYEKIIPLTCFHKVEESEIEEYIVDSYRLMFEKFSNDIQSLAPEKITTVEYSSFSKDPIESLEQIYNELNLSSFKQSLPDFEKELKSTEDYSRNTYETLSQDHKDELLERLLPIRQ